MSGHKVEGKQGDRPPYSANSGSGSSDPATTLHHEYPYLAEHGPPIDNVANQMREDEEYEQHHTLLWERIRHYCRDPFAEFMGTMIMIIFGDGSVAQVWLSTNKALPTWAQSKGEYQSISWA